MLGMRERVLALGGTMTVASTNHGVTVEALVPNAEYRNPQPIQPISSIRRSLGIFSRSRDLNFPMSIVCRSPSIPDRRIRNSRGGMG